MRFESRLEQQRSDKILQELHERPETPLPASCWNCNKNSGRSEKDASELENTSLCQKMNFPIHSSLPLLPLFLSACPLPPASSSSSLILFYQLVPTQMKLLRRRGGGQPSGRRPWSAAEWRTLHLQTFPSAREKWAGPPGRTLPSTIMGLGGGVESIGWNLFNYGREAGGDEEGEGGGASQEERRRGGRFSKLACSLALNTQWKLCHSRESVYNLFTQVDRSGRQTQILDMNSITFCKTNVQIFLQRETKAISLNNV